MCERMGWTFSEYDATPAKDMFEAFELWSLMDQERRQLAACLLQVRADSTALFERLVREGFDAG